jgi:hypothetical protein
LGNQSSAVKRNTSLTLPGLAVECRRSEPLLAAHELTSVCGIDSNLNTAALSIDGLSRHPSLTFQLTLCEDQGSYLKNAALES